MGRIGIFQKILFGGVLLATITLGLPKSELTDSYTASAQMIPAITVIQTGARDAKTFESDRALDAACRKSGQDQAVCLCLTHVMKYEMSLNTYRAAARLYGQSGDRSELHKTLSQEGFRPAEIKMAEDMERTLTASNDFGTRCANAKAYYKTSAK